MKQSSITSFFSLNNANGKAEEKTVKSPKKKSKRPRRISSDDSDGSSSHKKVCAGKEEKSSPISSPNLKNNCTEDKEKKSSPVVKSAPTLDKNYDKYNPNVSKYHPIDDAVWGKNQQVPYAALTRTFEEIENESGRLKIVEILNNFFRSLIVQSPDDLLPSLYLSLNRLGPAYEGLELNVAETTLMKAIAASTGRSMAQIKEDSQNLGDLGLVAEQSKSNQRMICEPARLTISKVFERLKEIAKLTGNASQTKKMEKIQSMLVACKKSEARYLIRSLTGKLRIGLAEQSILQALALACTLNPPELNQDVTIVNIAKKMASEDFKNEYDKMALILKTTYCECPNHDLIIPKLLEFGIEKLPDYCKLSPGIPLKPMLAHPTKGIQEVLTRFEGLKMTCEWKYDGERAQIHINGTEVSIFSRNQENNTSKYPDVIARINKCKDDSVVSCILDCEAVAWDRENMVIQPFQILSTRKRKDADESTIKVQVCVFMFDLLYFNGESLVKKPLMERRAILREHFKEVTGEWHFATSIDTSVLEEVQEALDESIKGNCEGLMIKALEKDATYEIAKRSHKWLKLKKDYLDSCGDSLDLVVIGGYFGKGKRTGTYGGFLLACYDQENDEYQSVCKIGTGFTDDSLNEHNQFFKSHVLNEPKVYYRYDSSHEPDHWFDSVQVWEVKCADLSLSPVHRAATGIVDAEKGVSLRFPRFIRIRDDKKTDEATSAQQIASMYSNQEQVKNQVKVKKKETEEFY